MGFREQIAEETREKAADEARAITNEAAEKGRRIVEDATNAADEILEEKALLAEKTIKEASREAEERIDQAIEELTAKSEGLQEQLQMLERIELRVTTNLRKLNFHLGKTLLILITTGVLTGATTGLLVTYFLLN